MKEHIADIEKTNREYRKKIESTKNSERQKRHVAIDKFLRLLNTKKQKIYQLQQQAKEQKHQLENLVEDSNQNLPIIEPSTSKRGRRKKQSTSQEIEQTEEKPTRKRRVNKGKQPLRNEYEDEYDSDYENKFKLEEEDFTIPRSFKERVKKKQRTNHNDE